MPQTTHEGSSPEPWVSGMRTLVKSGSRGEIVFSILYFINSLTLVLEDSNKMETLERLEDNEKKYRIDFFFPQPLQSNLNLE